MSLPHCANLRTDVGLGIAFRNTCDVEKLIETSLGQSLAPFSPTLGGQPERTHLRYHHEFAS